MYCIASYIKSVYYHNASGFQVAGYIRCSRLIKRTPFDDGSETVAVMDIGPLNKKCKTAAPMPLTASNIAAASSSSGVFAVGAPASQQYAASLSILDMNGSAPACTGGNVEFSHDERHQGEVEEEFVCAIRPADASFPHTGGSQLFSSLLSTASIVAHDLDLRSNNPDFSFQQHGVFNPQISSQVHLPQSQSLPQSLPASYQPQITPQGSCPSQIYSSMSAILSAAPDIVKTELFLDGGRVLDDQPL